VNTDGDILIAGISQPGSVHLAQEGAVGHRLDAVIDAGRRQPGGDNRHASAALSGADSLISGIKQAHIGRAAQLGAVPLAA